MSVLLVLVAHSGKTLQLDVQPTTRVDAVQQALVSFSGIPLSEQIVLCEGARLDPAKQLSAYKLPVDKASDFEERPVYVYSKAYLRNGAAPPEPETFPEVPVNVPVFAPVQLSHPLHKADSQRVRALPDTERQFQHHVRVGEAYWTAGQQRVQRGRVLLSEKEVQARCADAARANVEAHYNYILNIFNEFQEKYQRQYSSQQQLLSSFNDILAKMASTELPAQLQTGTRQRLLDLAPQQRLRDWHNDCRKAHEQFNIKVGELSSMFSLLRGDVEALFLQTPPVDLDALGAEMSTCETKLEEQGLLVQTFETDLKKVCALVESTVKALGGGAPSRGADSVHDACAALETMREHHRAHLLPQLMSNDKHLAAFVARCIAAKARMAADVVSQLQRISAQQSRIRDMKNRLHAYREVMAKHADAFAELRHSLLLPAAYRACLTECLRRRTWADLCGQQVGKLAEHLGRTRDKEVAKRETFHKHIQRYIPQDVISAMGLLTETAHCQVSAPPPDPHLLLIGPQDLQRLPQNRIELPPLPPSGSASPRPAGDDASTDLSGAAAADAVSEVDTIKLWADLAAEVAGSAVRDLVARRAEIASDKAAAAADDSSAERSSRSGLSRSATMDSSGNRPPVLAPQQSLPQPPASRSEAETVSLLQKAMVAKDVLISRLQGELKSSRQSCSAYEERISSLEGLLESQQQQHQEQQAQQHHHHQQQQQHQEQQQQQHQQRHQASSSQAYLQQQQQQVSLNPGSGSSSSPSPSPQLPFHPPMESPSTDTMSPESALFMGMSGMSAAGGGASSMGAGMVVGTPTFYGLPGAHPQFPGSSPMSEPASWGVGGSYPQGGYYQHGMGVLMQQDSYGAGKASTGGPGSAYLPPGSLGVQYPPFLHQGSMGSQEPHLLHAGGYAGYGTPRQGSTPGGMQWAPPGQNVSPRTGAKYTPGPGAGLGPALSSSPSTYAHPYMMASTGAFAMSPQTPSYLTGRTGPPQVSALAHQNYPGFQQYVGFNPPSSSAPPLIPQLQAGGHSPPPSHPLPTPDGLPPHMSPRSTPSPFVHSSIVPSFPRPPSSTPSTPVPSTFDEDAITHVLSAVDLVTEAQDSASIQAAAAALATMYSAATSTSTPSPTPPADTVTLLPHTATGPPMTQLHTFPRRGTGLDQQDSGSSVQTPTTGTAIRTPTWERVSRDAESAPAAAAGLTAAGSAQATAQGDLARMQGVSAGQGPVAESVGGLLHVGPPAAAAAESGSGAGSAEEALTAAEQDAEDAATPSPSLSSSGTFTDAESSPVDGSVFLPLAPASTPPVLSPPPTTASAPQPTHTPHTTPLGGPSSPTQGNSPDPTISPLSHNLIAGQHTTPTPDPHARTHPGAADPIDPDTDGSIPDIDEFESVDTRGMPGISHSPRVVFGGEGGGGSTSSDSASDGKSSPPPATMPGDSQLHGSQHSHAATGGVGGAGAGGHYPAYSLLSSGLNFLFRSTYLTEPPQPGDGSAQPPL